MKQFIYFPKVIIFKFILPCLLLFQTECLVFGQVFSNSVSNPFSLKVAEIRQTPCFADLDGDTDLDMLTGSTTGKFQYYQNIGSQGLPKFSTPLVNPFGLKNAGAYSRVIFGDLDQDGDFDLLVGSEIGELQYFQNTGSPTIPKFADAVFNPFSLNPNRKNMTPFLVDLDGDTDLDLLAGTETNGIAYQENIGTAKVPKYGDVIFDPFLIVTSETDLIPAMADLDNDGDLDLLVANQSPSFEYFENKGDKFKPSFLPSKINPFSIKPNTGDPAPFLVDLDHDGDLDIMTGQTSKFNYYENTQILINNQSSKELPLAIFPNPASNELNLIADELSDFSFLGIYSLNQKFAQSINFKHLGCIDLVDFSGGIYYLKISHFNKVYFIKFVKI